MNERIRELGRQATIWCVDQPNQEDFDAMWEEKFAELIVRECTNLLVEGSRVYYERAKRFGDGRTGEDAELCANTCLDNIDVINEHFGVEE